MVFPISAAPEFERVRSGGTDHKFYSGLYLLKTASGLSCGPKVRERGITCVERDSKETRCDGSAEFRSCISPAF